MHRNKNKIRFLNSLDSLFSCDVKHGRVHWTHCIISDFYSNNFVCFKKKRVVLYNHIL